MSNTFQIQCSYVNAYDPGISHLIIEGVRITITIDQQCEVSQDFHDSISFLGLWLRARFKIKYLAWL